MTYSSPSERPIIIAYRRASSPTLLLHSARVQIGLFAINTYQAFPDRSDSFHCPSYLTTSMYIWGGPGLAPSRGEAYCKDRTKHLTVFFALIPTK